MYGGFTGTERDFSERLQSNTTILSGDIDNNGLDSGDCYTVVTGAAGATIDGFVITCGWSPNYLKGGGITNTSGDMSVRHCFMVDNYAYYRGGGLYSTAGSMRMVNCVIADNDAYYYAGGIYLNSAFPAEILNCTIVDNSADAGVGGVSNYSATFIENSIIYDNVFGQTASNLGGYSPGISHCDIEGCGGSPDTGGTWVASFGVDDGGNIDEDPYFVNASDLDGTDGKLGTLDDGLQLDDDPFSPCIDTGDNDVVHEPLDITGWRRKCDGDGDDAITVDMGAYEFQDDIIIITGGDEVHFSGTTVGDGQYSSSTAFVNDYYSNILAPGTYPDAWGILGRANDESLDGIAVHEGTRVRIWSGIDYSGDLLLEVCGPALIENALWKDGAYGTYYYHIMDATFSPQALQDEFPQDVRYWSDDPEIHPEGEGLMHNDPTPPFDDPSLHYWGKGSIIIDAAP